MKQEQDRLFLMLPVSAYTMKYSPKLTEDSNATN